MQIETQDYLPFVEAANKICFFDIEATGLKGDYNSILCITILPFTGDPTTFSVKQLGNDQRVVREAKEFLSQYHCWTTYYGKGFDKPMLNTRLLKWGHDPLPTRHHIDMYYSLKANILTGRRSMGHLANWLGTNEQKMDVPVNAWNEMAFKMNEHMPVMIERCESDCRALRDLYNKTKHLIKDIKRN